MIKKLPNTIVVGKEVNLPREFVDSPVFQARNDITLGNISRIERKGDNEWEIGVRITGTKVEVFMNAFWDEQGEFVQTPLLKGCISL